MKSSFVVVLACLCVLCVGCSQQEEVEYGSLKEYYNSVDYSCEIDSDCVVKDVHNCCGYYPACVNEEAIVDKELVDSLCEREQMASVCGFASISGCRCEENKCVSYFEEE